MPVGAIVRGLPNWVDAPRILGPGDWTSGPDGIWKCKLERPAAADLQARLRGIGIGGSLLEVEVRPPLKRNLVRAGRTEDARRRRDTTPGFTRAGCQLDDEGRISLTPEALALELGERARGATVLDACGGCGGNAIGFARAGCEVICVELDEGRLEMARHNARLYQVADRIQFVRGRVQDVAPKQTADLFFADPPWGEDWDRGVTEPADLPLLPDLVSLSRRFERAWLKLPPSFDTGLLPDWAPTAWFGRAAGDRQRVKFLILAAGPGLS